MKRLYIIAGWGAVAKTTTAKRLGKWLKCPVLHNDTIYMTVANWLGVDKKHRFMVSDSHSWDNPGVLGLKSWKHYKTYKDLLFDAYSGAWENLNCEVAIIEGGIWWSNPEEYKMVLEILGNPEIQFLWFWPTYERREMYRTNRAKDLAKGKHVICPTAQTEREYLAANLNGVGLCPTKPWIIRDERKLFDYPKLGDLNYQTPECTTKKWRRYIFPPDLTGKTFLDIGCNTGAMMGYAAVRGAEVYGIDKYFAVINKAWEVMNDAKFWLADVEVFDFKRTFDYILCANMLHYVQNVELFVKKLAELTDYLILETPVHYKENVEYVYPPDPMGKGWKIPNRMTLLSILARHFKTTELINGSTGALGNERPVYRCKK